jgi:hypothetical protein
MSPRADRVTTRKQARARHDAASLDVDQAHANSSARGKSNTGTSTNAYADRLSRLAYWGLIISFALATTALGTQRSRFIHSYFVATGFLTTIGLGGLFFVLLHHLVNARWSVLACRQMQWVTNLLPWCMLLFLPNLLWAREIFPWMGSGAAAYLPESDHIGYTKAAWFFGRAAIYFIVWTGLTWAYNDQNSQIKRSSECERRLHLRRRLSGPAMLLFGVTTTFASFDWFMSLQPNWHSAIFGVYIFAGAIPAALAALALFIIQLEYLGIVRSSDNVSSRHDLGKLLFGFIFFWAYIAFSQYLLIWYAGIRSETSFFSQRFNGDWRSTTLWLFALQFVVPFTILLSAKAKQTPLVLFVVSLVVVVAHALDIIWVVMPALENGQSRLSFADCAPALLAFSLMLLLLAKGIKRETQLLQQTEESPTLQPAASL